MIKWLLSLLDTGAKKRIEDSPATIHLDMKCPMCLGTGKVKLEGQLKIDFPGV